MPASTTPIYPNSIIHWRRKLTGEVLPRTLTNQNPTLIGTAGKNGAIIHGITVQHLGNNTATVLRIYSQRDGAGYDLELELTLPATTTATETAALAPVAMTLPDSAVSGNKALHLEPGESLYVGLGTAIASGINVFIRGGNY